MKRRQVTVKGRWLLGVWIALAIVLSGAVWSEGEQSPCAKLLPTVKDLKGWQEVGGSYQYGKGEGLTKIYNGGYNLYTDKGVLEAAQKLYRKGSDILTVTVHTMKEAASARSFVGHWKKTNLKEKMSRTPAPGEGFVMVANGATVLYWARDRFFVTMMVPSDEKKATGYCLMALKVVARKVKNL